MKLCLIVMVALLGACAISIPTVAPDGRAARIIHCGGPWHDWGSCYVEAGRRCQQGYEIINRDSDAQNDRVWMQGRFRTRDMMVVCR